MMIENIDDTNIDSAMCQDQQMTREKGMVDCKQQKMNTVEDLSLNVSQEEEKILRGKQVSTKVQKRDGIRKNGNGRHRNENKCKTEDRLSSKESIKKEEGNEMLLGEAGSQRSKSTEKKFEMKEKQIDQTIAKEFERMKETYVSHESAIIESAVTCAYCRYEKEQSQSYPATSSMLCDRLQRLESIILELGSIAQESVERELKVEEVFSEAKRSILRFASNFKNSLNHGALGNFPAMFPEVHANDNDSSSRTTSATRNGTSKYITTLCELGKALCSQCTSLVAKYSKYNEVLNELHRFQNAAREKIRIEIDAITSVRFEFEEIKRALALKQDKKNDSSSFPNSYEATEESDEVRIEPENILRKSSEVKLRRRRHIERSKKRSEIARKLADRVDRLWNQVIVEKMRGEQVNKNATVSKKVVFAQKNSTAENGYMYEDEPQDMNNNNHEKGMEVYDCLYMCVCFPGKSR